MVILWPLSAEQGLKGGDVQNAGRKQRLKYAGNGRRAEEIFLEVSGS